MLKKTTLAVLGLTASCFVHAGTMGPTCTPGNVTVPCEATRWDLGVQALYMSPLLDGNAGYENIFQHYHHLRSNWEWGYRLEGSYHFGTGNDVTATWMHLNGSDFHSGFFGAVPTAQFITFNVPFNEYRDNHFDQVNLVMGQHTDVGMVKDMRFYGGLQYANIRMNAVNYYTQTPPAFALISVGSVSQYHNTDFNGVGPVVGLDYAYHVTDEFSVTANAATSILYGSSRYSAGYVAAPQGGIFAGIYAAKRVMIPSMEAKLGINYGYNMSNGVLNLEGGYQAVEYFNALHTRGPNALGVLTNTDFGLYGPYFGVKYVGNA